MAQVVASWKTAEQPVVHQLHAAHARVRLAQTQLGNAWLADCQQTGDVHSLVRSGWKHLRAALRELHTCVEQALMIRSRSLRHETVDSLHWALSLQEEHEDFLRLLPDWAPFQPTERVSRLLLKYTYSP